MMRWSWIIWAWGWLGTGVAAAHPPTGDAAAGECFPPCSPGYLCHERSCLEACNPTCGDGERCTAERVCESKHAPPTAGGTGVGSSVHPPPALGEVCIRRKFNWAAAAVPWSVTIDDETVGLLKAGSQQCFETTVGSHKVRVHFHVNGTKAEVVRTMEIAAEVPAQLTIKYYATGVISIVDPS